MQGRVSISADGRHVVYESINTNLVPNDTNGLRDIFWHDREAGEHGENRRAMSPARTTRATLWSAPLSLDRIRRRF